MKMNYLTWFFKITAIDWTIQNGIIDNQIVNLYDNNFSIKKKKAVTNLIKYYSCKMYFLSKND